MILREVVEDLDLPGQEPEADTLLTTDKVVSSSHTDMNIAIWIYRLGSGGAERVITELASSFARKGHNVTLLVHTDDNSYAFLLDERVRMVNLGKNLPGYLRPRTLFCLPRLFAFSRKNRPDIVFTTGVQHSCLLLLFSWTLHRSSRVVIRETNTLSVQSQTSRKAINRLGFFCARFLYRFADAVIAPSNGVASDLAKHIKHIEEKTLVIPNPVDSANLDEKSGEELPENELHLNEVPFLLSVGRLVPQKGHDILINAWAPVYKKTGTNLVILGEGPQRGNLEDLAAKLGVSEGLHLPGFDNNPFRYMGKARGFILSSYHEGLPNTLLQALACGCLVISTNCPSGPEEILQGGKIGKLVPVGDITAMQEAIEQMLAQNKDKYSGNWDKIKENYDPDRVAEKYIGVFDKVLDV